MGRFAITYTETKKFSNTSQVRLFITENHPLKLKHELNKTFAVNAITILFNTKFCMHRWKISFVLSAVPVGKMIWKRQNSNILTFHLLHRIQFRTVSVDPSVPETVSWHSAVRRYWKKFLLPWCDMNEKFNQWS